MKILIAALMIALASIPAHASDVEPYRGSGRVMDDPTCNDQGCPVPAPVPGRLL